jgi:hypothetical protein
VVLAEEKDILRWPRSSEDKDFHVDGKALINRPQKEEDKVQSEPQVPDVKPMKSEMAELSVDWLRGCEICNTGLCRKMDELTASLKKGGTGLPIREAAERLEEQATERIGEKVWTAEQIRARYLYYTGKMNAGRKPTTPKKAISPAASIEQAPLILLLRKRSTPHQMKFLLPLCLSLKGTKPLNFIKKNHEWGGHGAWGRHETDSLVIGYSVPSPG